jgi:hypothetical protein
MMFISAAVIFTLGLGHRETSNDEQTSSSAKPQAAEAASS